MLGILMVIILLTLYALSIDLMDRGCLAWHRDSVGRLLQALICLLCLLLTSLHLKSYIEDYEASPSEIVQENSMMNCFIPLLVFSGLAGIKLLCFRVRNSFMQLAITLSIVSLAFAFESHFDNEEFNAPLFIVGIPASCVLLAVSFQQLLEIYLEKEECM